MELREVLKQYYSGVIDAFQAAEKIVDMLQPLSQHSLDSQRRADDILKVEEILTTCSEVAEDFNMFYDCVVDYLE